MIFIDIYTLWKIKKIKQSAFFLPGKVKRKLKIYTKYTTTFDMIPKVMNLLSESVQLIIATP